MPRDFIAIEGIEEACQWLDEVGTTVGTRAYLSGFTAAAPVIAAELTLRTPVDKMAVLNQAHGGRYLLAVNVRHEIEMDARGRGGVLEVGFGSLGHIALWVEYGHNLVGHKPKVQSLFGRARRVGQLIGEVPPHPFMRPAFDAVNGRAIDAFLAGFKRVMTEVPGYSEAA